MKKSFFVVIVLFAVSLGHVQEIFDPVYTYLDIWQAKGYFFSPYNIRPYSPEVLKNLLEQVVDNGDDNARAVASKFLSDISGKLFSLEFSHETNLVTGELFKYRGVTGVNGTLLGHPADLLWIKTKAGAYFIDGQTAIIPYGDGQKQDIHEDSVYFLPPFISGDATAVLFSLTTYAWYGSASLWMSAGLGRTSVGPFFDNGIFIGPQAKQTANWSLNFTYNVFTFSTILMQLTAVTGTTNKYAVYHDYSYSVSDRLQIGLVETIVWGGEFKPQYLIPVTAFFYQQSMTSGGLYADNSLAGGYVVWRPFNGFVIKTTAFLDDIHPPEYIKLNFDTKTIGAAQTGFFWAPDSMLFSTISVDYTAIFPYMYTHNYYAGEDNYLHFGQSLGAALLPNSERYELLVRWHGAPITTRIRFIRHGNASEGVYEGSGDYWDNGWYNGEPTYQPPYPSTTTPKYFRFLSQNIIETVFQIDLSYTLSLPSIGLSLDAEYCFAWHNNYNLVDGMQAYFHYFKFMATWTL
ncbi:MAG: hypothetical protein GYA16_05795 [Spirochaetes bacterium]|nr:hypothetical protein [Spirochaetota bacterium]